MGKLSDAALALIGTGSLDDEMKAKVAQLGLEDNVHFLSIRNDVNELMQGMDVFLLP